MLSVMTYFIVVEKKIIYGTHSTKGPYQLETGTYGEIRYMFLWFSFAL